MLAGAAVVDRIGPRAGVAALVALCAVLAPGGGRAADLPCVAAGFAAVVSPGSPVPQPVGPALTVATPQSLTTDAYLDTTSGTGLSIAQIAIGAAGCADAAGTPGGTSTRAKAWSLLGGIVKGAALQADLVPAASAPGTGWRLRSRFDGLIVAGRPFDASQGATAEVGNWATVDRPGTIDAGDGAPLRFWAASLELRVTRAHGSLLPGTRFLIGWVSADRQPAPPAPPPIPKAPVVTTPSSTHVTTATTAAPPAQPKPSRSSVAKPAARPSTKPAARTAARRRSVKRGPVRRKQKPHVHARKHHHKPSILLGRPLGATPSLGGSTYDFPVHGEAAWGDTYGADRSDVPGGWHHGDDLFVALGTPVVAVADGTVFAVGWNSVGGWRLWLEDAEGNDFYYAHLSGYTRLARDNHRVRRGQVIGFVGNTGDAFTTIPHLHFEVHPFGLLSLGYDGAVDPTRYLASWQHPGGVDVLPPVPLPSPNFRGAGSLADFRRLLVLRPLARPLHPAGKARSTDATRSRDRGIEPRHEAAGGSRATKPSGDWAPAAAGALLVVIAGIAVVLTAREGRSAARPL